jgi:phenylacetate-CoA ligase
VLRYRTRDLTRFVAGACPCGRTTRRIARFAGRVDDMLVIRGVNVFPTEIERVVLADPETAAHYAVVVDRRAAMAELEVRVELGRPGGSHPQVAERLSRALTSVLRLRTRVTVLDPGGLPRPESGKAQRVFERLSERDPLGA